MSYTPITDLELALLRASPRLPLRRTVHVVAVWNNNANGFAYVHVPCLTPATLRHWTGEWLLVDPRERPVGIHNRCSICFVPLDEAPRQ